MASMARWIGWTANGRLKSSDASTRPVKLKASVVPVAAWNHRPSDEVPPMATSR